MFSSTAWIRLIRQVSLLSPHKGDSRRESLGELDFKHAVRFEAGYEFGDESAVSVGVGFGHEDRLPRDGVAATPEHRFLVFQRDRFGTPVKDIHRFFLYSVESGRSYARVARARDADVRIFAPRFPVIWELRASGPDAELSDRGCYARSRIVFPDCSGKFFIRPV